MFAGAGDEDGVRPPRPPSRRRSAASLRLGVHATPPREPDGRLEAEQVAIARRSPRSARRTTGAMTLSRRNSSRAAMLLRCTSTTGTPARRDRVAQRVGVVRERARVEHDGVAARPRASCSASMSAPSWLLCTKPTSHAELSAARSATAPRCPRASPVPYTSGSARRACSGSDRSGPGRAHRRSPLARAAHAAQTCLGEHLVVHRHAPRTLPGAVREHEPHAPAARPSCPTVIVSRSAVRVEAQPHPRAGPSASSSASCRARPRTRRRSPSALARAARRSACPRRPPSPCGTTPYPATVSMRVPERVAEVEALPRARPRARPPATTRALNAHAHRARRASTASGSRATQRRGVRLEPRQRPRSPSRTARLRDLGQPAAPLRRRAASRAPPCRRARATGGQKAPARFLPRGRSTPVLPPIELSTWASSVVGTCTTGMPRR